MPDLAACARVSTAIDPAINADLQALTERIRNTPHDPIAEAARDLLMAEAAYLAARDRLAVLVAL